MSESEGYKLAKDFFTIAPKYRTVENLARHFDKILISASNATTSPRIPMAGWQETLPDGTTKGAITHWRDDTTNPSIAADIKIRNSINEMILHCGMIGMSSEGTTDEIFDFIRPYLKTSAEPVVLESLKLKLRSALGPTWESRAKAVLKAANVEWV